MADRRITPARPDLAAAHLQGQIDAPRYVEGRDYCVMRGRIALRARPDSAAAQETELLYGERFTVYEEKEGWCWGQSALDGYVGYTHLVSLCEASAPTHRVTALSTPLLSAPDVKASVRDLLPLNAKLHIEKDNSPFVRIRDGYVALRHLAPIAAHQADFVAVAERFLGTPYVWGGKTHAGCDCSGLIQTALEAAGISAPRDTDMMEQQIGAAFSNRELKRGDLIFWKGHMGVMRDARTLLHANAFHMEVFSEPLAEAIARIDAIAGPVTSVKRL